MYIKIIKKTLSLIVKFCEKVTNTNIILLDIPHRYDLEESSCVNKEIQIFNRKLSKVTKLCKHVVVLVQTGRFLHNMVCT
jgi:hypothetical protein